MRKIALVLMCLLWCASSCLSSEKNEVFKLAKNGTLQELQDASAKGAKFNVTRSFDDGDDDTELFLVDESPLHIAAAFNQNQGVIKFLVSQGLDVNASASDGGMGSSPFGNPLSCAVRHKNLNAVRELLEAGADPNSDSYDGDSSSGNPVAIVALEYDDDAVAQLVLKALLEAGSDVNGGKEHDVPAEFKKSYLLPRSQWSSPDFRKNIHDTSSAELSYFYGSSTPLMYAVLLGKTNIANTLLDSKADANIYNAENKLALDYANELPDHATIRKSPVFDRLKTATAVASKAIEFDPDFDRADKLVGEGKIPMYVRDKGKFFYDHNLQEIKSGRVAVNAQKLNLRSQPNTKARIVAKVGREDTEKYPWYLGEWTSPQGEHWVLGEYQHSNGRSEAVWLYGKYVEVMGINSYYGRVHEIREEQREIIEAVRNTMYYTPYTAYNDYLPVGQQLEKISLGQWEWSISENGPSGFEKRVAVFRDHRRNNNNHMIEITVTFGRTTKKHEAFGLNKGDLALLAVILNGEVVYQYNMEINIGSSTVDPLLRLNGGRSLNDGLQEFANNFGKLFGVHANRMTARQFFNFIYTGEPY